MARCPHCSQRIVRSLDGYLPIGCAYGVLLRIHFPWHCGAPAHPFLLALALVRSSPPSRFFRSSPLSRFFRYVQSGSLRGCAQKQAPVRAYDSAGLGPQSRVLLVRSSRAQSSPYDTLAPVFAQVLRLAHGSIAVVGDHHTAE